MSINLIMDNNKHLSLNSRAYNYKSENNFENISVFLPLSYNNTDITDYTIQLNILNEDNEGDVITLSEFLRIDDRYKTTLKIPINWTYKAGKISFWLKFLSDTGEVGLTNTVTIRICDSQEISEYIPEQSLSLLDEWTAKMESLETKAEDAVKTMEEKEEDIKNISLNPAYIGDNGHWFTYDVETHGYIDSGIRADCGIQAQTKDNYWIMFS